jgi:multidrug efflux pump subunit AcrA (membrane-fusion protein)
MVEGGAALFEIVDLTEPWVAAKVFEGDLRRVDRAMDAIVMGDDLPAAGVRATLVAVSPVVDPSTRTVDVIYALPRAAAPGLLPIPGAPAPANAPPVLRVNQFVRVDLPVGDAHDVLAVPVSAVVELDGVPSVWVKTRAEVFVARPVALGRREGGWIAVRGDLTPDARVVTEGAPFLRGAAPVVGAEGALRPTTGEAR